MSILLDFSQVFISCTMQAIAHDSMQEIEEKFVRHIVLSSIASYNRRFRKEFGDLVICCDCDGGMYWRKEIFKYYKSSRKRNRAKSKFDWDTIFKILKKVKTELKDHFPYKVIETPRAEADDIIAVLSKFSNEPTVIISNDRDYLQLQKFSHVKQYSPYKGMFVSTDDPRLSLKEKILCGDDGDGVPNILSDDDVFEVSTKRQRPMRKEKLEYWLKESPGSFSKVTKEDQDTMYKNWDRNEVMIDLEYIPTPIQEQILETFEVTKAGNRKNLYSYFIKNGLNELTKHMNDF